VRRKRRVRVVRGVQKCVCRGLPARGWDEVVEWQDETAVLEVWTESVDVLGGSAAAISAHTVCWMDCRRASKCL
jgi:hypothetical protein